VSARRQRRRGAERRHSRGLPRHHAIVVGNTVWLLTPQRLERRLDTGMGPLSGSVSAKVRLSSNGSFFDDDRAIVLDGTNLRGPLVWDGARLVDELVRPRIGLRRVSRCWRLRSAHPIGVQGDVLWTWGGQSLSYRVGRQPGVGVPVLDQARWSAGHLRPPPPATSAWSPPTEAASKISN